MCGRAMDMKLVHLAERGVSRAKQKATADANTGKQLLKTKAQGSALGSTRSM